MASSVTRNEAVQLQAPLSVPLRNILLTASFSITTLAIAGYIWGQLGYEMLIVAMGWPHVLLGFIFYFGRVMRGGTRAWLSFLLLALATLTIWLLHYKYALTGLIYLFFLYHAFRDEVFVYLQTRARHHGNRNVFAVAGLGPLILLLLLIPQQQNFRQDLRRVELSLNDAVPQKSAWTLIPFKTVEKSAGRHFYFYLQVPHTAGVRAFTTDATVDDTYKLGQALVNDQPVPGTNDLLFQPRYESEDVAASNPPQATTQLLLTGGHRVGQSFTAERDNLTGVWVRIEKLEQPATDAPAVFHLASPPLLPYSSELSRVRVVLMILMAVLLAWRVIKARGDSHLWFYIIIIGGAFAITQMSLKNLGNAGYAAPLIFQFVVVFHYWSWYVFSYDKIRNSRMHFAPIDSTSSYQRMLNYLRSSRNFTLALIIAQALSVVGVVWYYRLNGPSALRYVFDYNNFLYFLVFHVTFSFNPQFRKKISSAT